MKTYKKILSALLAAIILLTTCVVSTYAEEFTPSEEPVIYFEVPENWTNYQRVFCHIWDSETHTSLANWQSKKELCTLVEGNLYSYDISKAGTLMEGKTYEVIFSLDIGLQTYETTFSTECFGDTLYCDDTVYENPLDNSKVCRGAFWKNQDRSIYGPVYQLTSLCNTIGVVIPPERTKEDVFMYFIINTLKAAQNNTHKSDQTIIEDAMYALELSPHQVRSVLTEASDKGYDFSVKWEGVRYGNAPETEPDDVMIYFEVPENWQDFRNVYCHIWDTESGTSFFAWQSRKEKCTHIEDNLYGYDLSNVGILEEGRNYEVIFHADIGVQTYEVYFSTECIGDTVYCDGSLYEDVFGSTTDAYVAYWRNQDKTHYGPIFMTDAWGYVYGTSIPLDKTKEEVFSEVLQNSWWNSHGLNYRSDQEIIDDVMNALDLTKEEVEAILNETPNYGPVIWNSRIYFGSFLEEPSSTPDETCDEVFYGDADMSGRVNIKDVTHIQKFCAGIVSDICEKAADVNLDGNINIRDATDIQKYLTGFAGNLPVPKENSYG